MKKSLIALLFAALLAAPAFANCNGPGDDGCGTEQSFTCVNSDNEPVDVRTVCAITLAECQARVEAAQENVNVCQTDVLNCNQQCGDCPDVTVQSRVLRCAKTKTLRNGTVVGRRCLLVTEAVER